MNDFEDTCFVCRYGKFRGFVIFCKIHNRDIGNREQIKAMKKLKCGSYERFDQIKLGV